MVVLNLRSLLQFLPQFLISAIVSVYFLFWVKQRGDKILPSWTFIIKSQPDHVVQIYNNEISFTPLHSDKFKEDPLLFSIGTAIDSIILWILLILSLSTSGKIAVFLPNLPFILRLIIYPVIGYLTLTSIYILSMHKIGTRKLNIFLSAVIVCFLIIIFFILPSMTWIFQINLLLRILFIYFALLTAVIIIYLLQFLQNSALKNKIMLFSSALVYILIVSMVLLKLISHVH